MKKLSCLLSLLFVSTGLYAADLIQIYRLAQQNDPSFAAAKATLEAGQEKAPQGLSGLLPVIAASVDSTRNHVEVTPLTTATHSTSKYNSHGYTVSLSQPLFRWQNWIAYGQSQQMVAQAEAHFVQARQDLILRVAQAYFDLLYAQDKLASVQSNKKAIAQQLESAKKHFEVGTATITDTHEAQARFDLACAQEIAAFNDLDVQRTALLTMLDKDPGSLAPTRSGITIAPPQPARIDQWVSAAENEAIAVQIQRIGLEIANAEVGKQRAGHLPTVDLVATSGKTRSLSALGSLADSRANTIGVQINIPLFQGGYVQSRSREAVAQRRAAEAMLESARLGAAQTARQHYLGVVNGVAQIKALEAGLTSSLLALDANKLGYEIGVRINIDVLNAEQQVFITRRDLAKARYETLMAQLRLKAAVGALGEDTLQQINALLDPTTAK